MSQAYLYDVQLNENFAYPTGGGAYASAIFAPTSSSLIVDGKLSYADAHGAFYDHVGRWYTSALLREPPATDGLPQPCVSQGAAVCDVDSTTHCTGGIDASIIVCIKAASGFSIDSNGFACKPQGPSCASDSTVCTTGTDTTRLKCNTPGPGYHAIDVDGWAVPCTSQPGCAEDDPAMVCTTGDDVTKLKCLTPGPGFHSVDSGGVVEPCVSQGSTLCAEDGANCTTHEPKDFLLVCVTPAAGFCVDGDGLVQEGTPQDPAQCGKDSGGHNMTSVSTFAGLQDAIETTASDAETEINIAHDMEFTEPISLIGRTGLTITSDSHVTLSGGGVTQLFVLKDGSDVTFTGMNFTHGYSGNAGQGRGGCFDVTDSSVTIRDSAIKRCVAG